MVRETEEGKQAASMIKAVDVVSRTFSIKYLNCLIVTVNINAKI